jgi:hypothetical protein
MLVLADRRFDTNAFLAAVAGAKAQLLVRAKSTRRPPMLAVLPDGSWLTRIAGLQLRVIDATITVTGTDGTVVTGTYRLFTTVLDHRADPAAALVQLYHERWEIESACFALRHTLRGGRPDRPDRGDRPGRAGPPAAGPPGPLQRPQGQIPRSPVTTPGPLMTTVPWSPPASPP